MHVVDQSTPTLTFVTNLFQTASVWLIANKKAKKKESGQTVNRRNSRGDQRDTRDSSHQLSQYEEEQLAKSRYTHVQSIVCVCV